MCLSQQVHSYITKRLQLVPTGQDFQLHWEDYTPQPFMTQRDNPLYCTCSLGLWVLRILLQPLHIVLHCMKCLSYSNIGGEVKYHKNMTGTSAPLHPPSLPPPPYMHKKSTLKPYLVSEFAKSIRNARGGGGHGESSNTWSPPESTWLPSYISTVDTRQSCYTNKSLERFHLLTTFPHSKT